MEPNCKECEYNNNGWCTKFKLQKPKAIIECVVTIDDDKDEPIATPKPRSSKKLKFVQETFNLDSEEEKLLYHAFHFVNKYYYDKKIDELDALIQNESSEQGLHNLNIIDGETELLDKCIAEQEKFNKLYEKLTKYCKGDK